MPSKQNLPEDIKEYPDNKKSKSNKKDETSTLKLDLANDSNETEPFQETSASSQNPSFGREIIQQESLQLPPLQSSSSSPNSASSLSGGSSQSIRSVQEQLPVEASSSSPQSLLVQSFHRNQPAPEQITGDSYQSIRQAQVPRSASSTSIRQFQEPNLATSTCKRLAQGPLLFSSPSKRLAKEPHSLNSPSKGQDQEPFSASSSNKAQSEEPISVNSSPSKQESEKKLSISSSPSKQSQEQIHIRSFREESVSEEIPYFGQGGNPELKSRGDTFYDRALRSVDGSICMNKSPLKEKPKKGKFWDIKLGFKHSNSEVQSKDTLLGKVSAAEILPVKNPSGENPSGENPSGENSSGENSSGENLSGQKSHSASPIRYLMDGLRSLGSPKRSKDSGISDETYSRPSTSRGLYSKESTKTKEKIKSINLKSKKKVSKSKDEVRHLSKLAREQKKKDLKNRSEPRTDESTIYSTLEDMDYTKTEAVSPRQRHSSNSENESEKKEDKEHEKTEQ